MSKKSITKRIFILLTFIFSLFCFYPNNYYFILPKASDISHIKQPQTTHKGVGVYIINLDRSPKRYEFIMENVRQMGFPSHRISAVDGNLLTKEDMEEKVDIKAFQTYNNRLYSGAIGCSLSHIKTWKAFLESNYEFALIFEDDVSFDPAKLESTINEISKSTELWDVCIFNMYGDGKKERPASERRPSLELQTINEDTKLLVYLHPISCAGCYILNRRAAAKYLEKAFPIVIAVDCYYLRAWEFDLKFTGVEPEIAHQTFNGHDSDIEKTKKIERTSLEDWISLIKHELFRKQTKFMCSIYALKQWMYCKCFSQNIASPL